MAASGSSSTFLHLYHHVVLPRDVPGAENSDLHHVESELLNRMIAAVKALEVLVPSEHHTDVDAVSLSLATCQKLHIDGQIDRAGLLAELNQLEHPRHALILSVMEQNAALLVHQAVSDSGERSTVFEAFETSATCEKVLASEGALQWDFPGQAVSLTQDVFSHDDLQGALVDFLSQASSESIKQFAAVTQKARAPLPEIRDTVDPTLVTGLLMTILEAIGPRENPLLLRKRVRDTVSFEKAYKPWRRWAFYLTVRVAVQRHLYRLLGADTGRLYYKIIMCNFMSALLDDSPSHLPHEACHHLRQKLGRRLSKLEVNYGRGQGNVHDQYSKLLKALEPTFQCSLSSAARFLDSSWEFHKRRTRRVIRELPLHASEQDLILKLPLSEHTLHGALSWRGVNVQAQNYSAAELLLRYENATVSRPILTAMHQYSEIYRYEEDNADTGRLDSNLPKEWERRCIKVSHLIESYISMAGDAYRAYPELLSRQLLTLMELWVIMDRAAVKCHHQLLDYHPVFEPNILDPLQLSSLEDMRRLQAVQSYIAKRCNSQKSRNTSTTIFMDPCVESFAVRYYDATAKSGNLKSLHRLIEQNAEKERGWKEEELEEKSQKYEGLVQQKAGLSCVGFEDGKHVRFCLFHKLKWEIKQVDIETFEYPLPEEEIQAKAALFELACPQAFAAYRDATWLILSKFAYPAEDSRNTTRLLREHRTLTHYAQRHDGKVTLASSAKSHLDSHYRTWTFPVTLAQVCKQFGMMKLRYFDSQGGRWVLRAHKPSFSAIFPIKLPQSSPYQSFQNCCDAWPSSNSVIASQTKCPQDVNVHEYMAWQGLLVGTHSRWISLLRELGSTNLNFSSDSTWAIVSRLVLEAGPSSTVDCLRDVHSVFHDSTYCAKLLIQVCQRLLAIRRNWREPVQMDTLISITIKCFSLSSDPKVRSDAADLLKMARDTTCDWCTSLRLASTEHGAGLSTFAIWASVLCKRAVYTLVKVAGNSMDPTTLQAFMAASIDLQNNLIGHFEDLPYNVQNAVIRDLFEVHQVRHLVGSGISNNQRAFLATLNDFWPIPPDCMQGLSYLFIDPETSWVCVTLPSALYAFTHYVHYHIVDGTLLIDGQQLGALPPEYVRNEIIQHLFGNQILKTFPSALPGMSHVLYQRMPYDHWVHVGFRGNQMIVRAEHQGGVYELINGQIFGREDLFDLPFPLVHNCYHWLNVSPGSTGDLEIRQDDPWKSKCSNWVLNIYSRRTTRKTGDTLVDPNSNLSLKVVRNFHKFEYPGQITVIQPARGHLRVELKRLELGFFVNRKGLLQSHQLGAVIAESRFQDAGTWYGLLSKIVICSVHNRSQRSILIPTGESTSLRDGEHISVTTKNVGEYLRFTLNEVLGRLECPAEPRLLYTKALYHAYTSHFLPDPLTGRTGVEEALSCLKSGSYLPWTPLTPLVASLLADLARLTPTRVYYPNNLKYLETVSWNPRLTPVIQDDRYRGLVETICQRNSELCMFASTEDTSPRLSSAEPHLETRAMSRIYAYKPKKDIIYRARDGTSVQDASVRVESTTKILFQWPPSVMNTEDLISRLARFPIIGGFLQAYDPILLTNQLNIDFGVDWGALTLAAIEATEDQKFSLMFLLGTIAFSSNADMDLIRVLMSFAFFEDLKTVKRPQARAYNRLQLGQVPAADELAKLMKGAGVPLAHIPLANFKGRKQRKLMSDRLEQEAKHEREIQRSCNELAASILAQWPNKELDLGGLVPVNNKLIDLQEALELVSPEWTRQIDNLELSQYLEEIQLVLNRHSPEEDTLAMGRRRQPEWISSAPRLYPLQFRGEAVPTLQELLEQTIPDCTASSLSSSPWSSPVPVSTMRNGTSSTQDPPTSSTPSSKPTSRSQVKVVPEIEELRTIVNPYKTSSSSVQNRYAVELELSLEALSNRVAQPKTEPEHYNPTNISEQIFRAKECYRQMIEDIYQVLQQQDRRYKWLCNVGLWPSMTPVTLLTELRSDSGIAWGNGVKKALVDLGLAITAFQRLLRIQDAARKGRQQQMLDELENPGHQNWSPMEYLDWLLLEIESDIMLRVEQIEVAHATIAPESGSNSILQLLMGKGKTSCILPMVSLVLADTKNLCRIMVPRPLLLQSAQVLQAKIGGLLMREVMHIPFSRKTPTEHTLIGKYGQLHSTIQKRGGVMLTLPEEVLSFKLSGLQRLCDGRLDEAQMMIQTQDWLDSHSRDVLDECDISLAIRTQLIYPSGSQMAVDGHPLRWQTIQALLYLVRVQIHDARRRFPRSIEVVGRPLSGYPLVYFLRKDAEEHLISVLIREICRGHTAFLPCSDFSEDSKAELETFISDPKADAENVRKVNEIFKEKTHLMNVARHLRGLFVHGILLSAMKKRWNVQYGLHPFRDPIAVPYQAKGVPSPSAEWGHPDFAIILTCLSFYYQGLSIAQFKQAFEELLKADEPSIEYEKWATHGLPEDLQDYKSINVEDILQLRELYQHVRFNTSLHDYYLNIFVFPSHAKQFSKKLQASGWDLILYDPLQEVNSRTTGFSGTNDSRHQLPLMIKQQDLTGLTHTNAEVLAYLLESRNRRYVRMVDRFGKRFGEEDLLKKLNSDGIRVLIDAGAQVLEHDNKDLAKAWLKIDHKASAAVYFDSDHRARALYLNGQDMPLVASSFAENLEGCLVYLDENHCRGTDLKLPPEARAALTLGPHLTKDALVQAAMRLRLLGKTQSVIFFAPPEVHQIILDLCEAPPDYRPDSSEVIRWLIYRTCNVMEQLEPLYLHQGTNYFTQRQARILHPNFLLKEKSRQRYCGKIQSKEAQTLKEQYEPKDQPAALPTVKSFMPALGSYVGELFQRREEFHDNEVTICSEVLEEVEQEREVEFQVESVREVQAPVHFQAMKVSALHEDIKNFVRTGRLPAGSDAYQSMFLSLQQTDLGSKHHAITAATSALASHLFVSTQFAHAVNTIEPNDNFLRPCQWVIWSRTTDVALLVSPEEANSLIPIMRCHSKPALTHLIVYAAPVTRRMLHFNNLDYYAIPPLPADFSAPIWLKVELGIFSGRLYFEWAEYQTLLKYVGIDIGVHQDGVNVVAKRKAFTKKPLTFLHDWLAIRRKGTDFEHTPMGFVTTGKPLTADHQFFLAAIPGGEDSEVESKINAAARAARKAEDEGSDGGDEHEQDLLFQGGDEDGENSDDERTYYGDDFEDAFDEDENTFFDGDAYVEKVVETE